MSNKEILSLRISGRDISIACPPEEREALEKAANYLNEKIEAIPCLLYTSPSPRDATLSRMPSSA